MLNKSQIGWNSEAHKRTFSFWNTFSKRRFNFAYGCFAEQKYLLSAIKNFENASVLDVGCATGTGYRYLRDNVPVSKFSYTGVDISETAVKEAERLYPNQTFVALNEPVKKYPGRFDVVISRDTILHQRKPFDFLDELIEKTGNTLIVRLRTRDEGPTFTDYENSAQMHYDQFWMPYIVLNTDELLDHLRATGRVKRITIQRSYEVLGGINYRFLPKDLYLTKTGGAETSAMVEFLSDGEKVKEVEVVYDSFLEGQQYLLAHRKKSIVHAVLDRVLMRAL